MSEPQVRTGDDAAGAPEGAGLHRVFFGHHKCASRFFRLNIFKQVALVNGWDVVSYAIRNPPYHFSDLPDLDLDMVDYERLKGDSIMLNLLNASPAVLAKVRQFTDRFRGLRVIRDPRSVLVSGYFHHRGKHPIFGPAGFVWDKLAIDRPILHALSEEDGLIHEMDNISGAVIIGQIMAWPGDPRVIEWRIEDINAARERFLAELTQHLAVEALPEIDWARNFSDSGGSEWQNHFTPRVRDAFKQRFGQALIDLGYERDLDW